MSRRRDRFVYVCLAEGHDETCRADLLPLWGRPEEDNSSMGIAGRGSTIATVVE